MKINQNVTFLNSRANAAAAVVAKGSTPPSTPVTELAGQTRLPASSALLPSTNGDFDAARVAEIRASISAGRYKVDTAKIADGLLSSVRDLLGRKSS